MEVLFIFAVFIPLMLVVFIPLICYFIGKSIENKHYKSLKKKERQLKHIFVFNEKYYQSGLKNANTLRMVSGSVVMSSDRFKQILASFKALFGGTLNSYTAMMELGRREAIIRMKEDAHRLGANVIYNVRLETSMLNSAEESAKRVSAEFLAYGTAITIKK